MAGLVYLLTITTILLPDKFSIRQANAQGTDHGIIGAVLDCNSHIGKEERVAMELAVEDFSKQNNRTLILHVKCSRGEPLQAALAAINLINKNNVHVILGPNSWDESSSVAEVGKQFNIPVLSFADSAPTWATEHWPTFIQAYSSASYQMNTVAGIVKSWMWHRVTVIYEDTNDMPNDIFDHLHGALADTQVQISSLVPISPFASVNKLSHKLGKLIKEQCRVFIVHASLHLAERIFELAKSKKMMESGYVWITTDSTTSLVQYMNASVISSMQGVLGVRRYLKETGKNYDDFTTRFTELFRQRYPDKKQYELGTSDLQAYDAAWTVGLAINLNGSILDNIRKTHFTGLSGRIQFKERRADPATQFQLINIFGKSYRELGFWSNESGFYTGEINNATSNDSSMVIFGHVFWPGGPWATPRGWDFPTKFNQLRIGVPNGSLTNKFVNVQYDPSTKQNVFSGFSIEVFKITVQHLNYSLPYELIPYGGSYTELVQRVQAKEFDGAIGDIAIISSRYDYVEFTHAHTESGVVMVVLIKSHPNKTMLFLKPFTRAMWLLIGLITIYNGIVIWYIERHYCSKLKGPFLQQIGTLLWLTFATLSPLHGEKLKNTLSKMAIIVWLLVSLLIFLSYTANLSSMLTVQRIKPKITIETLKSENAFIGCSRRSFLRGYLERALNFNTNNIKNFITPDGYAKALRSGEISAAFLETPVAKLFVAKYCNSFTIAGPTYKIGGYGFAFPKRSPLLPDLDEALLNVIETGVLEDLERNLISSEKCLDTQDDNETESLRPQSFWVLFLFSGGTSTAALAIYCVRGKKKVENPSSTHKMIWMFMLMILQKRRIKEFTRTTSDMEAPMNYPNTTPSSHT